MPAIVVGTLREAEDLSDEAKPNNLCNYCGLVVKKLTKDGLVPKHAAWEPNDEVRGGHGWYGPVIIVEKPATKISCPGEGTKPKKARATTIIVRQRDTK